ncbi:MAG: helix-turn-helix domain-containing protein [Candidatus Woesearchaeota archaeon]
MVGAFCEIYGQTADKRVIEHLLENQDIDLAVSDIAKGTGLSRPKAYQIIHNFEKKGYVRKTRIVGKTQLYMLNKKNRVVRLFMRDFKECLKMMLNEPEISCRNSSLGEVSAKDA